MSDLSRIPGFYSWTPEGDRLVFQIHSLEEKSNMEIWTWDLATQKANKITNGARLPQWLP